MKHLTLLFALSTLVLAQPRRGGPAMAMLDTDQDGIISAAEWRNAPAALAKLDQNSDGKVTPDELRPPGPPPGEGGPGGPGGEDMVGRMMSFDKDNDCKLSAAELPERMQGMMARADKNSDGFLTKDELTAAAPPPPQGDGRREGRGGGGGGPRGGMMRMDPILSAVDADQDGTLSAAEIQGAATAIGKLDKDSDGKLTREEVRPAFGGGRRGEGGPRP
jgi:Ca2+-binding EF-hand superfamily protein